MLRHGPVTAAIVLNVRRTGQAARHQRETSTLCHTSRRVACGNSATFVAASDEFGNAGMGEARPPIAEDWRGTPADRIDMVAKAGMVRQSRETRQLHFMRSHRMAHLIQRLCPYWEHENRWGRFQLRMVGPACHL